jgi:hypothetical protein
VIEEFHYARMTQTLEVLDLPSETFVSTRPVGPICPKHLDRAASRLLALRKQLAL